MQFDNKKSCERTPPRRKVGILRLENLDWRLVHPRLEFIVAQLFASDTNWWKTFILLDPQSKFNSVHIRILSTPFEPSEWVFKCYGVFGVWHQVFIFSSEHEGWVGNVLDFAASSMNHFLFDLSSHFVYKVFALCRIVTGRLKLICSCNAINVRFYIQHCSSSSLAV